MIHTVKRIKLSLLYPINWTFPTSFKWNFSRGCSTPFLLNLHLIQIIPISTNNINHQFKKDFHQKKEIWFYRFRLTFALKNTDSCKGYWGFPYSSESSPSIFRSPTSSSSLLRFMPVWKPEAEKDTTQVVSPLSPIIYMQLLQTYWLLMACWSLHLFNIKNELIFPSSHQE